jgi:hypothetical protein
MNAIDKHAISLLAWAGLLLAVGYWYIRREYL